MTIDKTEVRRLALSTASYYLRKGAKQSEETARTMEEVAPRINVENAHCVSFLRAEARELRKMAAELEENAHQ